MTAKWGRTVLSRAVMGALVVAVAFPPCVRGDVLLQGYYRRGDRGVPSPATDGTNTEWWWDHLAKQAKALRESGLTAIWLPPVMKGNSGGSSVGFDPFDDYDLGSKNQKGTIPTHYGTREQLERCVAILRANGINVYVDMVENHRNGDDGQFGFHYVDTSGNPTGGRFEKGPNDFHPNVPQDPDVPDGNHEISFGRDLAPINGGNHYIFNGLIANVDWMTRALDIQGYRLDYVKGISTDFLVPFLNSASMKDKFAVGEFWDTNVDAVANWVQPQMQNRSSAFDFPLRDLLKQMCSANGFFDMRRLDGAGLAARNPFRAVTFVENHDTDATDPIVKGKELAYAYLLTAEGYPCVFYKDYSTDPGCYALKPVLDNLIWIHEKIAAGQTRQRWKDDDVYAFERLGGAHLLVGLNDNQAADRQVTVDTDFGANVALHDYTGHSGDIQTDGGGKATITIPKNSAARGFVAYSRMGISGGFGSGSQSVTQEYEGAPDLDIGPAVAGQPVTICRVWAAPSTRVSGGLSRYDTTHWSGETRLTLELLNASGASVASQEYKLGTPSNAHLEASVQQPGWHTFRISASHPPADNQRLRYTLSTNYTAPQALQ